MGKTKHKKHHRHEEGGEDETGDAATNDGLKLVLKVGSKGKVSFKGAKSLI